MNFRFRQKVVPFYSTPALYSDPTHFQLPHGYTPHYFDMPKVAIFRAWLEECCRVFPTPDMDE